MRIALVHRGAVAERLQALAAAVAAGGHDLEVAELAAAKDWQPLVRGAECVLLVAPPGAEGEARELFEIVRELGRYCLVMPELEVLRVQRFLLAIKYREECVRRDWHARRPPRGAWAG